jgi:hypothetical protein
MDFKRGQDPIKSLGLGYGTKPLRKAWKILEFIRSKGEEGASLTEIQKFIWILNGYSEQDFEKTSLDRTKEYYKSIGKDYNPGFKFPHNDLRASRGYYSTGLYGARSNKGLLHKYCKKNEKGKWVLVRMPDPGENIYEEQSFKLVPESLNEIMNKNNRYIK